DQDAENKNIVVVDAATGKRLSNVARLGITREQGAIAFEPQTVPGDYHIYYLPFSFQGSWGSCNTAYHKPEGTASADWLADQKLTAAETAAGVWKSLPKAKVLRIEARLPFDSFYPMEVVALGAEVKQLLERNPQPYLLFPEDRRNPIRMFDDLPLKWVRSGPALQFSGEAQRDEFYTFQIGVYAAAQALDNLKIEFGDLKPERGAAIPSTALRCFNLGGTNWDGRPLVKRVNVRQGRVQPLWLGVQVPRETPAGAYRGMITLRWANAPASQMELLLRVKPEVIKDHGDGDLWRFSRLRWLDSTLGIDDGVVPPYTPLKVSRRTVKCLDRQVEFGADGLPASIKAGAKEILAEPIRFVIETAQGRLPVAWNPPAIIKKTAGTVVWQAVGAAEGLSLNCRATMEFDGHIGYEIKLVADRPLSVKDIRLEIPYRKDAAAYQAGMGCRGGYRSQAYSFRWPNGKFDSFWLGDVQAGLRCRLLGEYTGCLRTYFNPPAPARWRNEGKGGVTWEEAGAGQVLARAFTGPVALNAGESAEYTFTFLVTPVKPLDTASHFKTRYYHIEPEPPPKFTSPDPSPEALAAGVNVVNVHQATLRNPYINYPFLSREVIAPFTADMHAKDVRVKLYYTVRELSNYPPELWALRSLDSEVFADGGGGGFAWLQEHLRSGYTPAWYSPFPDGSADAAMVTSLSTRWYNYYVEGLGALMRDFHIDGLYLDSISYGRSVMQRMRKIMARENPRCLTDLHSGPWQGAMCACEGMEAFPYLDRVWYGECFDYAAMSPDQWLVEVSGIPFGIMGEMLANGGNPWRGVLYGMTTRLPWTTNGVRCDPRNVWKVWDGFGIAGAKMSGFWETDCPVKTDNPDVPATVYVKKGKALVAVASWAKEPTKVKLAIDWKALGLDPAKARLHAPPCERFQPAGEFAPDAEIPVDPGRGGMFILDENLPSSNVLAETIIPAPVTRYPPAEKRARSRGRTTYFVNPATGDDANSGLKPKQAWKTFSAVNARTFAAGDRIEIAPGRFAESLVPSGEGTEASPIEFHFAPGRFEIGSGDAVKLKLHISNGNDFPDRPKPIGILVQQAKHIRFTGENSDVVFCGTMIQLMNDHAEDITYTGLNFDLKRPTVSEFRPLEVGTNSAVIQIAEGSDYSISNGVFAWVGDGAIGPQLAQQAIPEEGKMWRTGDFNPFANATAEEIAPRKIRLTYKSGNAGLIAGRQYCFRNGGRDCVGGFNSRSKKLTWRNCNFYALTGLGIVSQFCEDITYDHVNAVPPAGTIRTCPAWADVFHFSGCRGKITVTDCKMSGTQDDPINVHGTHLRLIEKTSPDQVLVRFMHPQTYGFAAFQTGDRVEFVSHVNLRAFAANVVKAIERKTDKDWLLTFEKPAANFAANDVIENISWYPDLEVRNCLVTMDATRGFLITTRGKVLVESNTFVRTAMSAIDISDDANSWFESGPVRDVTIRGNTFIQCGGPVIRIAPENQTAKPEEPVHTNIRILDNFFDGGGVSAKSVKGLTITGNRFSAKALPVQQNACTDVVIENNKLEAKE
ncbi:MAG: glycoside hydrolase domain-containing protein, partial [bacterium]